MGALDDAAHVEKRTSSGTFTTPLLGKRCLIVEDEEFVAAAEAKLLQRSGAIVEVVGTVLDARRSLARNDYDLLIVDLGLPDGNGVSVVDAAMCLNARPAVLVVTGRVDLMGVEGRILGDLVVTKGELGEYLVASARGALLAAGRLGASTDRPASEAGSARVADFFEGRKLTDRQRQVFMLLAAGVGPKEVGARLGISDSTVRFHARSLYRKCGTHNQREALALFGRAMAGVADSDVVELSATRRVSRR